jgi:hypothetical protein
MRRPFASNAEEFAMTPQTAAAAKSGPIIQIPAIPSFASVRNLLFGGYCALMAWEIWSRTITVWVVGGPLEPPGLVLSLVNRFLGTNFDQKMPIPWANATFAHYVIGVLGYPVLYYIISRGLRHWDMILDALVWAAFTLYLLYTLTSGGFTSWTGIFWLIVTLVTATRFINPNSLVARSLSWGSFTWFNALGIMAPIAGLPFLLMDWGGSLSFMSYVGHILFGFLAALIFEQREGNA